MKVHIFLQAVTEEWKQHPHWRYGQAVYNVAAKLFLPQNKDSLYIGGETMYDPFYDNAKVNAYINYLKGRGILE